MFNFYRLGFFLILLIPISLRAEIIIDGVLDEPAWKEAKVIEDFYEVYPYSLREVRDYNTQILVLETEDGLYFGFKNFLFSDITGGLCGV